MGLDLRRKALTGEWYLEMRNGPGQSFGVCMSLRVSVRTCVCIYMVLLGCKFANCFLFIYVYIYEK